MVDGEGEPPGECTRCQTRAGSRAALRLTTQPLGRDPPDTREVLVQAPFEGLFPIRGFAFDKS